FLFTVSELHAAAIFSPFYDLTHFATGFHAHVAEADIGFRFFVAHAEDVRAFTTQGDLVLDHKRFTRQRNDGFGEDDVWARIFYDGLANDERLLVGIFYSRQRAVVVYTDKQDPAGCVCEGDHLFDYLIGRRCAAFEFKMRAFALANK